MILGSILLNDYSNTVLGWSVHEMANQCFVTLRDEVGIQVINGKLRKMAANSHPLPLPAT